ncbi:hypothetical protein QBC43DRAFT_40762 [Cladorrhinum sp. PSN259]|nr:hypothetical protein QBC43DRAFT_40762 [Cladorrhinum sp. PSN259]
MPHYEASSSALSIIKPRLIRLSVNHGPKWRARKTGHGGDMQRPNFQRAPRNTSRTYFVAAIIVKLFPCRFQLPCASSNLCSGGAPNDETSYRVRSTCNHIRHLEQLGFFISQQAPPSALHLPSCQPWCFRQSVIGSSITSRRDMASGHRPSQQRATHEASRRLRAKFFTRKNHREGLGASEVVQRILHFHVRWVQREQSMTFPWIGIPTLAQCSPLIQGEAPLLEWDFGKLPNDPFSVPPLR